MATQILQYIDSLQEEPVSEELEEAAEDYGIRQGAELKPFAIKFFKAGAKWQKEQMMKDAVDAVVHKSGSIYLKEMSRNAIATALEDYKDGDAVKLVITKED